MKNLMLILCLLKISSCAQSYVEHKKKTRYLQPDILIESNPSGADIFIYPEGIIAKTPFNANRMQLKDSTIEARKDGYKNQKIFIRKKEKFLFFQTFFGNLLFAPLYPLFVISDLKNGWDLEKPADKITIDFKEKK